MSRTGLIEAGLPKGLWDKASDSAAYTKNQLPHKALGGKIPIEIILAKDPVNKRKNLRPFGQRVSCYDYEVKENLSARSYEGRIVGHTTTFGTYWVRTADGATKLAKNPIPIILDNESEESSSEEEIPPPEVSDWDQPEPPPEDLVPAAAPKKKRRTAEEWTSLVGSRRSTRDRKPKIFAVGTDPDHHNDQQARTSPQAKEWAVARIKERDQLHKYQVFTKIRKSDIPEGTRIVDTKWVYVIKRKADVTIEKFKARKVGRGFTQEEGINYDETYAQMMQTETFKILLVIALYRNWAIRQWDIVAAYLQALLKHDIYIMDINEDGETEYWKLHKALYGLKQAGHEWFEMLCDVMKACGIQQCIGDEGTYVSTKEQVIVRTYVDDLLGIAPTEAQLDQAERSVEGRVELHKRGKPAKMLGMELHWSKEQVILTQTTIIESIAKKYLHLQDGANGRKASLPSESQHYQKPEESEEVQNYQAIVGGLLFIGRMTRPEISIHINLLEQRKKDHDRNNYQTALKVLKYLYLTKFDGLHLKKADDLEIRIYVDASYGGEKSRSQSGVMMTLGNPLLGWYSRRQEIVSLSITEAEYIADCEGAKDSAWVQQFLAELGITTRPTVNTDSERAYNLSKVSKFARRSRHIEHQYHYLCQQVRSGKLRIRTIAGKNNPADILMKLLPMRVMNAWKELWMSTSPTCSQRKPPS